MIESFILGAASLLSGNTLSFFEETATLPAATVEIETEQPFNAVTLFQPEGKDLPIIFYKDPYSKQKKHWEPTEDPTPEGDKIRPDLLEMLFFDEPQTKLTLTSAGETKVVFHFYNTVIPGENLTAQLSTSDQGMLDPDNIPSEIKFGSSRPPKFFSRKDWGADESLRVASKTQKLFARKWFSTEAKVVPPKYKPIIKERKNSDGEYWFWPISESKNIAKFIIHHTGEAVKRSRLRSPKELMRAIYSYHTITRGWGDIGYNYVIDKQGNIYEGRAGGPKAVGAHTAYYNIGTIGISLMGNFQHEKPTKAQTNVLPLLIADLALKFNIDATGRSEYLGKNTYNIAGHREVARKGHGTACPGKNMMKALPEIRKNVGKFMKLLEDFENRDRKMGRDFLQKSSAAKTHLKDKKFIRQEKVDPIQFSQITKPYITQRHKTSFIEVKAKNTSDFVWKKRSEITLKNTPEGMSHEALLLTDETPPQAIGTFRGRIKVTSTPNGKYDIILVPAFLKEKRFAEQIAKLTGIFPLQVSGDRRLAYADRSLFSDTVQRVKELSVNLKASIIQPKFYKSSATKKSAPIYNTNTPKVKVKIAGFDKSFAEISTNAPTEIWERNKKIATIREGQTIKIFRQLINGEKFIKIVNGKKEWILGKNSLGRISLRTNGVLTIENYRNPRFGSDRIQYNSFRRALHFYPNSGISLMVVNELPIEEYLWGLGEEPSNEPEAKKHAIFTLARSYALVYSTKKRKFNTDLYDLEDDPRTSQLYLGYDWERYHIEQKALIKQTEGDVLTYEGRPVIGPYFTQSAGRSSSKWSSQYPWCRARELPYDKGLVLSGHGVGLSGHSARILAEKGKSTEEILKYFFKDVEVRGAY